MAAETEEQGDPEPTEKALGPYPVPVETLARLRRLQVLVAQAGHHKPSKGLLLSALIHGAPEDGRELEMEVLVPYRLAHPDEDMQDGEQLPSN